MATDGEVIQATIAVIDRLLRQRGTTSETNHDITIEVMPLKNHTDVCVYFEGRTTYDLVVRAIEQHLWPRAVAGVAKTSKLTEPRGQDHRWMINVAVRRSR